MLYRSQQRCVANFLNAIKSKVASKGEKLPIAYGDWDHRGTFSKVILLAKELNYKTDC